MRRSGDRSRRRRVRQTLAGLLAAALVAVAAAGASAAQAALVPSRAYDLVQSSAGGPSVADRAAAADLDGDGHVDLATADFEMNKPGVWWGDGDGRLVLGIPDLFPPPYWYRLSSGVTTGDLDEDGALDVVVSELQGGTVYAMLNDGDRTFTLAPDGPAVTGVNNPEDLVVADVDEDGHLDVVTSSGHSNSVAVLLGDGSGRLVPASWSPIPIAQGTHGIASGDLDSDGHVDLVLAGQSPSRIVALLGDGDGRFTPTAGSPHVSSGLPVDAELGDVDGDGNLDVAVANQGGNVPVLLGDGSGGFAPAAGSPFSVGTDLGAIQTHTVIFADLDGDGRDELLAGTTPGLTIYRSRIRVWGAPGPGEPLEELPGGPIPLDFRYVASLTPTDLDGDGKLDVVLGTMDGGITGLIARDELGVALSGDGGGTVAGMPAGESCAEDCADYAASGTELTLTATPDDRSDFAGWSGCDEQTGTDCVVRLEHDRAVTATFELERRPPTAEIAAPEEDLEVAVGTRVEAAFGCRNDAEGSGIDGCAGSVTDPGGERAAIEPGDPLPTALLGEHEIEVRATDRAGNEATATAHYRVVEPTPVARPADGAPAEPGPPPPSEPTPPASPSAPADARCESDAVVLTGVALRAGRLTLRGVAARALAGRQVRALGDGRPIARGTVGRDGSIAVRSAAPAEHASVRYRLVVAGRSSTAVRPRGKLVLSTRTRGADGRLRVAGRLPGVGAGEVLTVSVRPLCARSGKVAATVTTEARGRVRLALAAPLRGERPLVYRVRMRTRSTSLPGRSVAFPLVAR